MLETVKYKLILIWQCCRTGWAQGPLCGYRSKTKAQLMLKGNPKVEFMALSCHMKGCAFGVGNECLYIWLYVQGSYLKGFHFPILLKLLSQPANHCPKLDKVVPFIFSDRDQNLKRWMEGFHRVWQLSPQHSSHTCTQHDSYLLSAAQQNPTAWKGNHIPNLATTQTGRNKFMTSPSEAKILTLLKYWLNYHMDF